MADISRAPQVITTATIALGVTRTWTLWDKIPATVASHFGVDGTPNDLSGKVGFFVAYLLLTVFVLASLVGSGELMGRIPDRYLNLPHKEYWLKSGRLPEARAKMKQNMWWLTAATTLLSVGTLELVLMANIKRGPLNSTLMGLMIGAYLAFTLVWKVRMMRAFTPPSTP